MIFSKKTAFGSAADKKDNIQEKVERAQKFTSEAREAAMRCYASPLFKDYLNKLLIAREMIVELFLEINDEDFRVEWKKFKELQIQFRQLEELLKQLSKYVDKSNDEKRD